MTIPTYTDAESQQKYADKHNVEENTLVRGTFGNTPAQATKVTDRGVHFSNGEAHCHREVLHAVENGHMEIVGQRSTQ